MSDGDGPSWSVNKERFAETYEHVKGDKWRRTGIALARCAVAGEIIETLEGPEQAKAGDWVVKGERGEQWPVPPADFEKNYLCAALVAGGLLVMLRIENNAERGYDAIAAGAIMGAAFLTRTAAIAPAAAGLLVLATKGKWRAAVQVQRRLVDGRLSLDLVDRPARVRPDCRSVLFSIELCVVEHRVQLRVAGEARRSRGEHTVGDSGRTVPGAASGERRRVDCRRRVRPLHCPRVVARAAFVDRDRFSAVHRAVMAWAFPPVRFLVPILPFLVWFLFVGAGPLRPAVGVLAAVFVATSSVATWQLAQATERRGGTWFDAGGVDDWRGISDLYRWVDANTPREAVLIATHDPTGYLLTGRTAVRPDSMDPLMLYYNVKGRPVDTDAVDVAYRERVLRISADYVVITPRDSIDTLERLSARFPGSFRLVEGNVKAKHAIYQVDRTKLRPR